MLVSVGARLRPLGYLEEAQAASLRERRLYLIEFEVKLRQALCKMSITESHLKKQERMKELRNARVKQTQNYVTDQNLTGLLNNTKWVRIFEELDSRNLPFELRLLLNNESIFCQKILELESTSILTYGFDDFIEFLEILELEIPRRTLEDFLINNHIDFENSTDKLIISAYR